MEAPLRGEPHLLELTGKPTSKHLAITLHMLLENDREDIPDVPAVYFVSPTSDVIQRVVKDLQSKLYSSIHLNFVRPVPRPLLEELAKSTLSTNTVGMLTKLPRTTCQRGTTSTGRRRSRFRHGRSHDIC